MRQAFAGLLWSKQFYHYVVRDWLEGRSRRSRLRRPERKLGRNHEWTHLYNSDVISMPDKWEYPWYAAWDLAFHCMPLALVDSEFAKEQLMLMLREWYMHPTGNFRRTSGIRRRQSAGARLGRLARLQDRAEAHGQGRPARSWSACSTSCCSISPGGSTARTPRGTTCSRAASWGWTTSACSTAASRCRAAATSNRPTAPAGWPCTA